MFLDTPIFPDHFSIQSTSPPFLNCIAIRQLRDTEWGTKYLCYKSALKKCNITWSPDGPVEGQECINTVMPYERSAKFWANSFLCMPRDSVLKLSWSISRPLNELKCLVMRKGRQTYFLCGKFKHRKMGRKMFEHRTIFSRASSLFVTIYVLNETKKWHSWTKLTTALSATGCYQFL